MKGVLEKVNFPITIGDYNKLRTADDVRAAVGDFDANLKPLVEAFVGRLMTERRLERAVAGGVA